MKPRFFRQPAEFRRWLEANHLEAEELWVGFHKVATGKASLTWQESIDEALCFGWIDGVRYSIDATAYRIRFTPRRTGSKWSEVNVQRAEALIRDGRMSHAGRRAFEAGRVRKTEYSFEQKKPIALSPTFAKRLAANAKARAFFEKQAPWYRRTASFWVMSAKQEATRERRLKVLIACSARGQKIPPLKWP